MDRNGPTPKWVRLAPLVLLVLSLLNFVFWAFIGLPDQGWSRAALACAWAVLALVFGAIVLRARD
jgi:hypothetical protein